MPDDKLPDRPVTTCMTCNGSGEVIGKGSPESGTKLKRRNLCRDCKGKGWL